MKKLILCISMILLLSGSYSQNCTSLLDQYWSPSASQWKDQAIQTFSYNTGNYVTYTLIQSWSSSSWHNSGQISYYYYPENVVQYSYAQIWSTLNTAWENYKKSSSFYNSALQPIQMYVYNWGGSAWYYYLKYLRDYDVSGLLIEEDRQRYNTYTDIWEDYERTIYTNNADSTVQNYIIQKYNDTTATWENYQRYSFSYSGSKKISSRLLENWINSAWSDYTTINYTYDTNDFLTEELTMEYDTNTLGWINDTKWIYYNNFTGNPDSIVIKRWNTVNSAWDNDHKKTYTYEGNSIEETDYSVFEIFPNPATTYLYYKIKDNNEYNVTLFDFAGNIIYSSQSDSRKDGQLFIGYLLPGTYILSIQNDTCRFSKLFFKQ